MPHDNYIAIFFYFFANSLVQQATYSHAYYLCTVQSIHILQNDHFITLAYACVIVLFL